MTLPTAAKPSSESPRETRSTVVVSTRVVSLRTPGPKRRASEAASLAGGAAGPCVASRRSASPAITSELVPDAEAVPQVVGGLDVRTRDAAAHGRAVARVDRPGVLDADVRHHGPKAHRALVVARVGRHERDRGVEGTAAEHAVGGGAASVPE